MSYLIDTMVVSEMRKRQRDPGVVGLVTETPTRDLFVSVVSIGEIEAGIVKQRGLDQPFAERLERWFDGFLRHYAAQCLPVTLPVVRTWGRLVTESRRKEPDLLIAATALEHDLTVVTRNVRHFAPLGLRVLDPFSSATA